MSPSFKICFHFGPMPDFHFFYWLAYFQSLKWWLDRGSCLLVLRAVLQPCCWLCLETPSCHSRLLRSRSLPILLPALRWTRWFFSWHLQIVPNRMCTASRQSCCCRTPDLPFWVRFSETRSRPPCQCSTWFLLVPPASRWFVARTQAKVFRYCWWSKKS